MVIVYPDTRRPVGPGGFRPWTPFSPNDLELCYAMPPWVAQRLNNYPQPSVGRALRAPLPLPFTAAEVQKALVDVRRARLLNRACADVDPASVRIALLVLRVLRPRNQGWISYGGRSVNLQCVLYRLVGKPLSYVHDTCGLAPPAPRLVYRVSEVQTTFEPPPEFADPGDSQRDGFYGPVAVVPDGPGGERAPPRPRGLIGYDIEEVPPPTPDPFAFSLFEISGTHAIKG